MNTDIKEEASKLKLRIAKEEVKMAIKQQYADAPEGGYEERESVIEMLLQELEKRTESLSIQVGNLSKQFHLILMDKSASVGREDSPTEKYPAHSPLAKRLEALNELHKKIAYQIDTLGQDAEV
jgi:hypothetical protein